MRLTIALVLLVSLAGCGAASDSTDTTEPTTASSTAVESTTTTSATTAPVEGEAALVAFATEDLASAESVDAGQIELVLFERVTWRDGSLGCPVEGSSYTQALVDGFRIVLAIDGDEFHYHGADSGEPFLCENPQDPAPGGGAGDK